MFKQPVQSGFFGLLILLALVAGCSPNPLASTPRTIEPARPADSPPASQNPAGAVRPLAGHPLAAVFDGGTRQLAVLCPGSAPSESASIAVFGAAQVPPRVIDLQARASALTGDDHGTVYLAARGGYLVVHLAAGEPEHVRVADAATDFTAIARRADGKLELGSADGAVYTPSVAGTATVEQSEQDLRPR